MAQDDVQERTEEATPKRLREARERGQVARSRELNTFGVLLAGGAGLTMLGPNVVEGLTDLMRETFQSNHAVLTTPDRLLPTLTDAILDMVLALMPFMAVLVMTAVAVPLMLGGWTLSGKAVSFQWERIDPVKGLGRIFSVKGLMELVKAMLKFSFMGFVGCAWLWHTAPEYMSLGGTALGTGTADAADFVLIAFMVAVSPMAVIAAIDVTFQVWDHARQLRMSRRELKDEMKETEGSPELKARIRRQQQELAQRRMMEAVPGADVVIVNPTHYAVALRYDPAKMPAPVLVAKGVDLIALRIREIGTANGLPTVRSPLLARALFYNAKLEQEIPAALYMAVAQVLAYVMRLSDDGVSLDAERLETLQVPDGLRTEQR